jgi:Family of unknown function (DUF5681)
VQEQPKQPNFRPPTAGSWQAGKSGNPKGRPMGTRQKLAESMIPDIVAKWQEHGANVIDRLIVEEPKAFAMLAASLLPKEVSLSVEQRLPGNLDAQSYGTLRRVVELIEHYAPAGAEPGDVFETLERALVAAYAEPTVALPPPPYSR